MTTPDRDTAAKLAAACDALTERLNRAPACSDRRDGKPCILRLRKPGRRSPRVVSFADLDPNKMCAACAALWHVSMAAEALRIVDRVERETEAERAAR